MQHELRGRPGERQLDADAAGEAPPRQVHRELGVVADGAHVGGQAEGPVIGRVSHRRSLLGLGEVGSTVRISAPSAVTRMVCSNCAERSPSAVTAVQPSGQRAARQSPSVIIGSMVKTMPGTMVVRARGSTWWGIWSEVWKVSPMPWPQ